MPLPPIGAGFSAAGASRAPPAHRCPLLLRRRVACASRPSVSASPPPPRRVRLLPIGARFSAAHPSVPALLPPARRVPVPPIGARFSPAGTSRGLSSIGAPLLCSSSSSNHRALHILRRWCSLLSEMGVKIIRGSRNEKYAAHDWLCESCGNLNKVEELLIFDIPPLNCTVCKKKFPGIIYFCLADVEVNGRSILPDVKDQRSSPECISYAFAHAQELNDIIENIIMEDNSPVEILDPVILEDAYKHCFPKMKNDSEEEGLHKLLYTSLLLKEHSRKINKGPERSTRSDAFLVGRFRHEDIYRCIADGRAVVACFPVGKKFFELKFGEVYYRPIFEKYENHAVVLIGVLIEPCRLIFIFLNSYGKKFCALYDENGSIIMGGVGMIEGAFICNPIVLSRSWEKVDTGGLSGSWRDGLTKKELRDEVDVLIIRPPRPGFTEQDIWKSSGGILSPCKGALGGVQLGNVNVLRSEKETILCSLLHQQLQVLCNKRFQAAMGGVINIAINSYLYGMIHEVHIKMDDGCRPEKYLSDIETWNKAEQQLTETLNEFGKVQAKHHEAGFHVDIDLIDRIIEKKFRDA
ncbi:hypothetical protein ACP4OV_012890 [Aristida adscensionis]